MSITIDLPPAEMNFVEKQASEQNIGVEEYTLNMIRKAMRNAEYLAKLDRAYKDKAEGKGVMFTDEEWEHYVNEQELRWAGL